MTYEILMDRKDRGGESLRDAENEMHRNQLSRRQIPEISNTSTVVC